jgi:hypothetical protein
MNENKDKFPIALSIDYTGRQYFITSKHIHAIGRTIQEAFKDFTDQFDIRKEWDKNVFEGVREDGGMVSFSGGVVSTAGSTGLGSSDIFGVIK